jgi:hypothetical protein
MHKNHAGVQLCFLYPDSVITLLTQVGKSPWAWPTKSREAASYRCGADANSPTGN